MDSTSDSILAYKLTKDTVTLLKVEEGHWTERTVRLSRR